jgi:hypothetical protein
MTTSLGTWPGREAWFTPRPTDTQESGFDSPLGTGQSLGVTKPCSRFQLNLSVHRSTMWATLRWSRVGFDSETAICPGSVTSGDKIEIDEAVVKALTWGTEWEEWNKPNEPARFLAEAGDQAVPRILTVLLGCAAGAGPKGWWEGAPELCRVLGSIGTDQAKRALSMILNTESHVGEWSWVRTAAVEAIGEPPSHLP